MKNKFKYFLWIFVILFCCEVKSDDDNLIIESTVLPVAADMPTLANGHIGFVIYGDSILMNGLYNGVRGESHRARIPNYANLMPNVDCSEGCLYQLNMGKGYFQNTIRRSNYKIVQQLYAHRYYNRAILNSFTLERTAQQGNISVDFNIDHGNETSIDLELTNSKVIQELNLRINCYVTKLIEDPRYQTSPSKVCIGYTIPQESLALNENENSTSFLHITAVAKTEEEVIKEVEDIMQASDVFEKHSTVWEEHWNRFGIFLEGNAKVNEIIHSSMFYLISNLPSEATNQPKYPYYGLSPGGLPKGGQVYMEYQGHSFWDTEIWMHPPILLFNPKWSEDILSYRYNVRKAAADNALNTNYKGYRYPWESGFTGCEVTPDCCPEVVEYQHHIIADIAFAFRSHLAATHDEEWWNNFGCDIAYNTAKFWESRVKYNDTTENYDIRNVMGPDEDHHDIDNNGYTNVIAGFNLYFGDFAGCYCRNVLNISDSDYNRFAKIAKSLTLLYDEQNDRHPQFEGYAGENIKQADTVMLGYPLQLPMNASTKRNDLEYYDTKTRVNGPAMTWAMHTIGFLDLEDQDTAAAYFERSYTLYTRAPFNAWSEAIPGQPAAGNFITGAGGFLQSVINGYAGIRLNFDNLIITKSYLPPAGSKLTLNGIVYLGNVFRLEVIPGFKILTVITNGAEDIQVLVDGLEQGKLASYRDIPLRIPADSEITLKPLKKFGESQGCEMRETVIGKKVSEEPVEYEDDEWTLGANYLPDFYELPTLSNGHVGFVIYSDSIFMNGLYNGQNGNSHRARIPNFGNIETDLQCTGNNCAYQLNLKHGYFERIAYQGRSFKVSQQMYAHRYFNRVIVNRFVLEQLDGTLAYSVQLRLSPGNETSVDVVLVDEFNYSENGTQITVKAYTTRVIEDNRYQKDLSRVYVAYTTVPAQLTVSTGQKTSEYVHYTAIGSTEAEVKKELADVLNHTYSQVFDKHTLIWENHMNNYEMTVEDNKELNQIIHSSLFYLISNLPSEESNQPNGQFYGLSPGGLAKGAEGKDYQGHSFWDTEIWMHPPLLLLNPKWSEDILSYRYSTRKAAEDHAKFTSNSTLIRNTTYEGYRYPWESGYTGREVTPLFAWEVIEYQHHITADIAFAYRSHLAATHDLDWWKKYGCEIAYNTAKFWESRVQFNESTKFYDINNIMGPDEDHFNVTNNVYTNVIAAINLYFGDFAACTCKDELKELDADNFAKIAKSLKMVYDEENDYHPQFEEYEGQSIKQADVVLLGYPLQLPMNSTTKYNNLHVYDNVTRDTGPAMTWSMHTIGFLDLQDEVNAARTFQKSYSVYNHEPFKTWSENQPGVEGSGNFITGVGGFLQSVMNGYGGIRLHFDHLSITNFFTPPGTKGLTLRGITYLNSRFNLNIKDDLAILMFTDVSKDHPLKITLSPSNKEFEAKAGTLITFRRTEKLVMKPDSNIFGSCEMKETVLNVPASASIFKTNIFIGMVIALFAILMK